MLSTATKIWIARGASGLIRILRGVVGRGPEVHVLRNGLTWSLDLREGIDLSIYLLGSFEPATVRCYSHLVRPGDIVLDIGANVGAHTLPLARLVDGNGRVIAFEPTRWAYGKLVTNLRLNPGLESRVVALQTMLVDHVGRAAEPALYSSWPLMGGDSVHPEHRGHLMETSGARACTLDQAVSEQQLPRVDFIKLDVDGHEHEVLAGGREIMLEYRPVVLMELAPYVFPQPEAFDQMLEVLWGSGYSLVPVSGGKSLPREPRRVRALIPVGSSMNVIARPE